MEFLTQAIRALPEAAKSPLALIAYAIAVLAWGLISFRVVRNKNVLTHLDKLPKGDRLKALEAEFGNVPLREGLSAEQFLRSRIHTYYFAAFAIVCAVVVILFAIAASQSKEITSVDGCEKPPADTFANTDLNLGFAVTAWSGLAKGEVNAKTDSKIVSLVSTVAHDGRLQKYLNCLLLKRDGYTREQVAWYDEIALIGKANPSLDLLMTWMAGNPFPSSSYNVRVVVMDSRLRVYDKDNLGTNGLKIRAILNEMPEKFDIRTELATPGFKDEEYVLRHTPQLIIIHLSSFYPWDRDKVDLDLTALRKADQEFQGFVDYVLQNSSSKILVYTRGVPDLSRYAKDVAKVVQDGFARQRRYIEQHKDRVRLYLLPAGKSFGDVEVARSLRNEARLLLGSPSKKSV